MEKGELLISNTLNTFLIEISKTVKRSNHIMHNSSINSLNMKYLECYIALIGLTLNFTMKFGHRISQNKESFLKKTAVIINYKYMNNKSELTFFGTGRAAVMRSDRFCFFNYIKDY